MKDTSAGRTSGEPDWWLLAEGDRIAARINGWVWFTVEGGVVVGNNRTMPIVAAETRIANDHWFKVYDATTETWRDGPLPGKDAAHWASQWSTR